MGGNLVTINDAAENQFLVNAFGGSELFWIGLNDVAQEGVFKWINGEPVTYTNWNSGEPNNYGNEDYVHFNWGSSGRWNDIPNSGYGGLHRGIIEVLNGTSAITEGDDTLYGTPGNDTIDGLGGNKIRLIAAIHYNRQKFYIREVLTHAEYEKNKWKEQKKADDRYRENTASLDKLKANILYYSQRIRI